MTAITPTPVGQSITTTFDMSLSCGCRTAMRSRGAPFDPVVGQSWWFFQGHWSVLVETATPRDNGSTTTPGAPS